MSKTNQEPKRCEFDGCEKTRSCKGLCPGHYEQKRKGRELRPLRGKAKPTPWIAGLRVCPGCKELKGEGEYSRNATQASGFDSHCRECFRWKNITRRYSLTKAEWMAIWAHQGKRCASCGTTDAGSERGFHTDHDHSCCDSRESCGDCVMGIICQNCNLLGGRWESPQFLAYREAVRVLGQPLRTHVVTLYQLSA